MDRKQKQHLTQQHLAHGVELYETGNAQYPAEARCEQCDLHLWWATQDDVDYWQSFGAAIKRQPITRKHLRLVQ